MWASETPWARWMRQTRRMCSQVKCYFHVLYVNFNSKHSHLSTKTYKHKQFQLMRTHTLSTVTLDTPPLYPQMLCLQSIKLTFAKCHHAYIHALMIAHIWPRARCALWPLCDLRHKHTAQAAMWCSIKCVSFTNLVPQNDLFYIFMVSCL